MSERHHELATAVECGSAELAIYSLAFMLDDRLQELTEAIRRLAPAQMADGAAWADLQSETEALDGDQVV